MVSRRGLAIDGVLLLDKPAGLSSNHALQRARRILNARKAGLRPRRALDGLVRRSCRSA